MIVIHKETIGDGTLFNMNEIALMEVLKYGRIDDEVERLRELYGLELELIKSRTNDDVCMVYDDVKWYVSKHG